MSNVSVVTPYATTQPGTLGQFGSKIAATCIGVAEGAVSVARWLAESTPEDQAAVERARQEERQERLRVRSTLPDFEPTSISVSSTHLNVRDLESLLSSARKLAYEIDPLPGPLTAKHEETPVLLRRASGERLAIEHKEGQGLVLHTAAPHQDIRDLMRQHTLDRTIEHFAGRGMDFKAEETENGEFRVFAKEQDAGLPGGPAEIRAQVQADGTAVVDVDKVVGDRCEEIVTALARAIGAGISSRRRKDASLNLPSLRTKNARKISHGT